jgi:hypothetical protein
MVQKLSKYQLIKLVRKIAEGECSSEAQRDKLISIIEENIPAPDITSYIFHHDPELTPEEIVDKALAYKPIILGPPSNEHK